MSEILFKEKSERKIVICVAVVNFTLIWYYINMFY